MPSLAEKMAKVDAYIFDTFGETMRIGTRDVNGCFYEREELFDQGVLTGVSPTFHCRYPEVTGLANGDAVEVYRRGEWHEYRFDRFVPPRGDETGLVKAVLMEFTP